MAEVLRSASSSFSRSSSPMLASPHPPIFDSSASLSILANSSGSISEEPISSLVDGESKPKESNNKSEQISLLTVLISLVRKSLIVCSPNQNDMCAIEIGWPTDVNHITHVTFDRFHGFLGLPVEFGPEIYEGAPSVSAKIFGISPELMQLSYDERGNTIPKILLLMQNHLYMRGGLQAEGIFRINAENNQEEHVRDELNRGVVPENIDVHCLACLIKAWFRELPNGVLDSLTPDQVNECESEEDCVELVALLPQTAVSLLDWSINLMADVVESEGVNKMNARNIAVVFAPNMTKMADPLTALSHAVQVMNFIKKLVEKTLRERAYRVVDMSFLMDDGMVLC